MSHRGDLRLPLTALLWLAAALSAQVAAAPLGITKNFSPDYIGPNDTATLTITQTNPDNAARPNDTDLSGADARVRDPYLAHRMKVDQDNLKLNDRNGGLFAPSHPSKP